MRVYIHRPAWNGEPDRYYRANVSRRWVESNDNGRMVSCGLTVKIGSNDGTLGRGQLGALIRQGKATEIDRDEWNHSGCQSSCVKRGAESCRW